jgi:hypothetical protein
MKLKHGLLVVLMALAAWPIASTASTASATESPIASAATVCADHPNQASAQSAKDTRDPDGDGIYCESLPCPCLPPDPRAGSGEPAAPPVEEQPVAPPVEEEPEVEDTCARPKAVQRLVFSADKYPNIRRHFRGALRRGWPRTLVLNRPGADARRDRLLEGIPTRAGFDRDEYPPAVGRGRGKGLRRGTHPRGWKADVRYVRSSENRSHGASLGAKLSDFCNGTRFRYVFR